MVRLQRLSRQASAALLERSAGHALDADRNEWLCQACAGTPLLLQVAAWALEHGGSLAAAPGAQAFGRRLLLERFVGVGAEAFAYLQAASVLGVRFRPALAGELAGLDEGATYIVHARLLRASLLDDSRRGLVYVRASAVRSGAARLPAALGQRAPARQGVPPHGATRRTGRAAAEHALSARLVGDPLAVEIVSRAGRQALAQGTLESGCAHLAGAVRLAGEAAGVQLLIVTVQSSGPVAGIPCCCSESCGHGPRGGGGDL